MGIPWKADEEEAAFEAARRYDTDRLRWLMGTRRIWMAAAVMGWVTAAAGGLAVAGLTPLKAETLRVVRVDRATGAVDTLSEVEGLASVQRDEAVIRYFLNQYVVARESYGEADRKRLFDTVAVLSSPEEQRRWATFYNESPQSPQVVYARDGAASVQVRSISFYSDQVALVRFTRTERKNGRESQDGYAATVTFGFSDEKLTQAAMLRNPLGFLVSEYRRDAEVIR